MQELINAFNLREQSDTYYNLYLEHLKSLDIEYFYLSKKTRAFSVETIAKRKYNVIISFDNPKDIVIVLHLHDGKRYGHHQFQLNLNKDVLEHSFKELNNIIIGSIIFR
jgi:hypothetical protein